MCTSRTLRDGKGSLLKEACSLLGLALCRGNGAEQSAAREIPCRAPSTLERKALLLQRQLQHQVWRENEIPSRAVEVPMISHSCGDNILHISRQISFCLVDRNHYLVCGRFWQRVHDSMWKSGLFPPREAAYRLPV